MGQARNGRRLGPGGGPGHSAHGQRGRQGPLEPELYIVDGRVLRFQIWDGRGEMSKQMRRWIMGRKVLIRFACTTGEAWESEFSLRGSSPAIKKVVQAIYQKQSGKGD